MQYVKLENNFFVDDKLCMKNPLKICTSPVCVISHLIGNFIDKICDASRQISFFCYDWL